MNSRAVATRPTVEAIGLGCMPMSWAYSAAERDDVESVAVIRRALDVGVTLIDTADAYGPFSNEELVGQTLQGRRDEAVLATKVGLLPDPDGHWHAHHDATSPPRITQTDSTDRQHRPADRGKTGACTSG